jgi:hypothetical protein
MILVHLSLLEKSLRRSRGVIICGSDTLAIAMPEAENVQFHAH